MRRISNPKLIASAAIIAAIATLGLSAAADGEDREEVVVARPGLPGQAAHVIPNPVRGEMVVSGEFGLTLIDVATAATRRFRLGGGTGGVVASPDGSIFYTPLGVAHRLLAVSSTTGETLWQSAISGFPWEVAITPDGKRVYVTQQLQGEAVAVDTTTHEVRSLAEVSVRSWPLGIPISPDGKRIYVPTSGETKVFDAETYQEVAPLPVAGGQITFSRDGSEIYFAGEGLIAVDARTGAERWTLGAGKA